MTNKYVVAVGTCGYMPDNHYDCDTILQCKAAIQDIKYDFLNGWNNYTDSWEYSGNSNFTRRDLLNGGITIAMLDRPGNPHSIPIYIDVCIGEGE